MRVLAWSPCASSILEQQHDSQVPTQSLLHVLQVLSPSLVGRAPVWGDALSLRGSWVCLDAPYFEAPGELRKGCGELVGLLHT